MVIKQEVVSVMPSLEYYKLAKAFFTFEKIAKKNSFYLNEIQRMEQSIKEMNPIYDISPELICDSMNGGIKDESI